MFLLSMLRRPPEETQSVMHDCQGSRQGYHDVHGVGESFCQTYYCRQSWEMMGLTGRSPVEKVCDPEEVYLGQGVVEKSGDVECKGEWKEGK